MKESLKGYFPQDIRKLAMGLFDDQHPLFEHVGNHVHRYPKIHYRPVIKNRISLYGIGSEGQNVLYMLSQQFEKSPISMSGKKLTVKDIDLKFADFKFGFSESFISWQVKNSLIFFEKYKLFQERSRDLKKAYSEIFKHHIEWLCRNFDYNFDQKIKLVLPDNINEHPCRIKREAGIYPGAKQIGFYANFYLPPAVGHGAGLGWGILY
jgi:hypothetical protein